MKVSILIFLSLTLVVGCYYDSEEDLYLAADCVTTNVSYNNDIKPILVNSCLSCHNASSTIGAGINLDGHAFVLPYATNGSLVGSVKHQGFSAMPKGASKLDACKIAKLESWVQAGSPNN